MSVTTSQASLTWQSRRILNKRIAKAQRPLTTTGMLIRAVGAAVGFSTPSHFASTFRQRVE